MAQYLFFTTNMGNGAYTATQMPEFGQYSKNNIIIAEMKFNYNTKCVVRLPKHIVVCPNPDKCTYECVWPKCDIKMPQRGWITRDGIFVIPGIISLPIFKFKYVDKFGVAIIFKELSKIYLPEHRGYVSYYSDNVDYNNCHGLIARYSEYSTLTYDTTVSELIQIYKGDIQLYSPKCIPIGADDVVYGDNVLYTLKGAVCIKYTKYSSILLAYNGNLYEGKYKRDFIYYKGVMYGVSSYNTIVLPRVESTILPDGFAATSIIESVDVTVKDYFIISFMDRSLRLFYTKKWKHVELTKYTIIIEDVDGVNEYYVLPDPTLKLYNTKLPFYLILPTNASGYIEKKIYPIPRIIVNPVLGEFAESSAV